jgi:RIO kinase 2
MYLSRLAAQKEHAFMRVLHREGFPVPEPVAWSRHTVVMEFIDSFPLRMIDSIPNPGKLYAELMAIIVRLAQRGLIHGDFNEFNILIKEENNPSNAASPTLTPIIIDFPQTISTNHVNAEMYFGRDVACIKRYFDRKFRYTSDEPGPFFKDAIRDVDPGKRLDVEVEASGFSKKMAKDLDRYVEAAGGDQGEQDAAEGGVDEEVEDEDGNEEDGDELFEDDEENVLGEDTHDAEQNLEEQLAALTMGEGVASKQLRPSDYGLVPLDLPQDPDVVAEKVKTKKKASGWAI